VGDGQHVRRQSQARKEVDIAKEETEEILTVIAAASSSTNSKEI
jgi:hypothetical protein